MLIRTILKKIRFYNLSLLDDNDLNKNLIHIYETLESLLTESKHGLYIEKIKEAILLLQSITTTRTDRQFFPSYQTIGHLLKENNHSVVKNKEPQSTNTFQPVAYLTGIELAELHQLLMEYYLHHYPTWQYSYPLNENGEIDNIAVQRWQLEQTRLASSSSLVDFKRDICIFDEKGGTKKDAKLRLRNLVSQASAYHLSDHALLFRWCRKNGGQGIESVIPKLFEHRHFNNQYHFVVNKAKSIEHNWYIKHGKMNYDYGTIIYILGNISNHSTQLMKTPAGAVEWIKFKKVVEYQRQGLLYPLMRINCNIELTIIDKQVVPIKKALIVTSMTNALRPPMQHHVRSHSFFYQPTLRSTIDIETKATDKRENIEPKNCKF